MFYAFAVSSCGALAVALAEQQRGTPGAVDAVRLLEVQQDVGDVRQVLAVEGEDLALAADQVVDALELRVR